MRDKGEGGRMIYESGIIGCKVESGAEGQVTGHGDFPGWREDEYLKNANYIKNWGDPVYNKLSPNKQFPTTLLTNNK